MPTVVYHHRTQGVDAQGIHVTEMCRAFETLGYQVVKVSIHANERPGSVQRTGLLSRIIARMPRSVYELLEIGYNFWGCARLWRAVHRHRPAFIYERYALFNVCGVVVSFLTRTPLVLEINSPLALERREFGGLALRRLAQATETWITRQASRNITVTQVLKEMLVANGARPETITVMPNGVNADEYVSSGPVEQQRRPVTLGFVGWFRRWHGLAESIAALDDDGLFAAGVRLVLVGDGPARPALESLITSRRLGNAVSITGSMDRRSVFHLLAGLDIALQPAATAYACPMKLIEYLAAGKAVVAPDQANIRELVSDGENGLLFPPGDWASMAKRVRALVHDRALLGRLGQNARRTIVAKDLTWLGNARRVAMLVQETASCGLC
ncbi:Glycosyltransferase [Desulfovibrio sp. DV]|uniref:glycosyltransferase n=1 Tax=Desulfovibrio sp. DV TaxID=1844708 RepID=UPI00094B8942|nr:glycosyltransferase [Desulfovibrio sp. DV]OLN29419.1 Glycosyltransferase [Desulfovibrio sp. DV]